MKNKIGQIWIETVLYTLIGLAVIGLVLAFATPRIKSAQEKVLVEQSIEIMNKLDQVITQVQDRGIGNVKSYTFTIKRGRLVIDSNNNEIKLILEGLDSEYSEPNTPIEEGRVKLLTEVGANSNSVTLTLDYRLSGTDIRYEQQNDLYEFNQAPTPYTFFVRTLELNDGGESKMIISIDQGLS
ncbi:hypothetical protein COU54_01875 [Candidatus Pacearchaeota archaeon CG10_big_fil_rev_8_21_14_0_10_31_24]|nr:MAG: hypothetical protein COU54_01875 [Candidatus Pacearchaeota archaeon CG10_big_fil_rev_8_21_14_0_10_31_24]